MSGSASCADNDEASVSAAWIERSSCCTRCLSALDRFWRAWRSSAVKRRVAAAFCRRPAPVPDDASSAAAAVALPAEAVTPEGASTSSSTSGWKRTRPLRTSSSESATERIRYLSWVTSSTVPGYADRASSRTSQLGRSRWLVGSSSTNRLTGFTMIRASARRVRSPPDRSPIRRSTVSPRNPKLPSTERRLRPWSSPTAARNSSSTVASNRKESTWCWANSAMSTLLPIST